MEQVRLLLRTLDVFTSTNLRGDSMDTSRAGDEPPPAEQLEREILSRRREFLKRALVTAAYVSPLAMSFAAQDLARAASCPGVGNCGNSEWAHDKKDDK